MLPDGMAALDRTLDRFRRLFQRFPEEMETFANFPSLFLGLTDGAGELEYYDGPLRVVGCRRERGRQRAAGRRIIPSTWAKWPRTIPISKSAYYLPLGYPDGIYRVGPLARLNLVTHCGTPRADHELGALRTFAGSPLLSSFYYHHARLIEMLHVSSASRSCWRIPIFLSPHVRAFSEPNCEEGVGMSEAPRGTLLHHYKVDRNGLIQWANLIIATGHNNLAMNRGIKQTASYFVRDGKLSEGALNRVEAVIRAFDPCLSCSTHAAGQMPLRIDLLGAGGALLDSDASAHEAARSSLDSAIRCAKMTGSVGAPLSCWSEPLPQVSPRF